MAVVPAVAMIGDTVIQGGSGGTITRVDSTGAYPTQVLRDIDLHRVTPDNDTDGAPQAATLGWYPWFDDNLGTLYNITASPAPTATQIHVTPDPSWTTNEWVGFTVTVNNATGGGWHNALVAITANDSDSITVASWPGGTPLHTEAAWFSEGRFSDVALNGAWRTATEVSASVVPTRGGGSILAGNQGVSPDQMLLRYLWKNVWKVSPYFQFWKYAHTAPTTGGWNDAGTARAAYIAKLVKVNAAWALVAGGDTLRWDYCIIDQGHTDVDDWAAGNNPANLLLYKDDMDEMIAWLRSSAVFNNASLRVLLVNHDAQILNVLTPAGMALGNGERIKVALGDALVRTVSFDGLELPLRGANATTPLWQPNEDRVHYSNCVYARDYPKQIGKHIEFWEAGVAPNVSGAIPVYVVIGDSITVGPITETYTTALGSPTLTGTVRDARQKIFNRSSGNVEAYDLATNSQTSGSVAPTVGGPEFSLTVELLKRHSDTGFVVIKRGSNSSALLADVTTYSSGNGGRWSKSFAATEHYDELKADIENAVHYINTVLDKQAELMCFFVCLGTNDQALAGGGALFVAELPVFVKNLRDDFGTHTTGKKTPFIWRRPQLGTATSIVAESIAIRAGLDAYAKTDAQFVSMDVDDLERQAGDIHETPESSIAHGQRYDEKLELVELPNCAVD